MSFSPETAAWLEALPEERRQPVTQLCKTLADHLPTGFEEFCAKGMVHFAVPKSLYPPGYHCDPNQPLPFISVASTKGNIALHHMGLYADPDLLEWFQAAYPLHSKAKLDMGKGCVRFKKPDHIPLDLIRELAGKVTPEAWISDYEAIFRKDGKR